MPPTAASTEPTVIATMHSIIISRLPNMSASRDMIGVATALVSRVAVTSQAASSATDPEDAGKVGQQRDDHGLLQGDDGAAQRQMAMTAQVGVRFLETIGTVGAAMTLTPTPPPMTTEPGL